MSQGGGQSKGLIPASWARSSSTGSVDELLWVQVPKCHSRSEFGERKGGEEEEKGRKKETNMRYGGRTEQRTEVRKEKKETKLRSPKGEHQ